MSFSENVIGEDFKERYAFNCPECDETNHAAPSIFMKMGMNFGHGSCLGCGQLLYLSIDDNNERMIAALRAGFFKEDE